MREAVNADRLRRFMRELAVRSNAGGRIYLTGGASAVLLGWRGTTIDVDIAVDPSDDRVLRAMTGLGVNVDLASPADFIPPLAGWQERSPFIVREGGLSFHHYDFYSQCLAKIERGHRHDVEDVQEMLGRGLVERGRLSAFFDEILPSLYLYPAIHAPSFHSTLQLQ